MDGDVEAIVAKLTKAQRAYLTTRAEWSVPVAWAEKRWMTYPPSNVHRVLIRLGLVDRSGQVLDLGLRVRQALETPPTSEEKQDG